MASIEEYYADYKELDYKKETFYTEIKWLEDYVAENKPKGFPVTEDRRRIAALRQLIEEMS